jgi:2-iminobutanoate/2-iminopropanoate deaminase
MRKRITLSALALAVVVLVVAMPTVAAPPTAPAEEAGDTVSFLNSGKLLPKGLPFSEAVQVGGTLYLSGQVGIVPGTNGLVPGGIAPEARQAMTNIKTTLATYGYSLDDVVKCTVMLADIEEWATFNEVYKTFFSAHYPARSAFGASGLALGARVEVECIAVRVD